MSLSGGDGIRTRAEGFLRPARQPAAPTQTHSGAMPSRRLRRRLLLRLEQVATERQKAPIYRAFRAVLSPPHLWDLLKDGQRPPASTKNGHLPPTHGAMDDGGAPVTLAHRLRANTVTRCRFRTAPFVVESTTRPRRHTTCGTCS